MKKVIYIFVFMTIVVNAAMGQNDRQLIRNGNKAYRSHKYAQSEIDYKKALERNPSNPQAVYNLGCAFMSQGNDSAAVAQFGNAAKLESDKSRRAMSYHNMGVVLQKQKNYEKAIEAYKNALRNNPKDEDTRYNLALCKRLLQQQQQQQQNKNQKDDSKNNKKNKDNKQNNDNKKKQNNDEKREQINRQNAEQLLNAAMQEEKATLERLKKGMQRPSSRKTDKNW